MKIISLNVGLPRLVFRDGEPVSTGIFKKPIAGRVMMRTLNLDGDRQADLSVHGGPSKAVYVYPAAHYDFWKREFPAMDLRWGMFGENLTTTGFLETEINIGDQFRIGTSEVMVTQPRLPCYKLALKFGRPDIIKRFLQSERTGFYLAVLKEGEVGAGDEFEPLARDAHDVRVSDITRLYTREKHNTELLRRVIRVEALPENWREYFQHHLEKLSKSS